jgi:hypothetical protein
MVKRLIKIYTPFICAITAIIHGVLFLKGYKGQAYYILNDITGHSILLILYVLATSKKMCKWYKITCNLLLSIHILNISYSIFSFSYFTAIYASISLNIFAVITFLIYRIKQGITKILC